MRSGGHPTSNSPSDYAYLLRNVCWGVVEAKKLTIGPDGVLIQACRYSRGLAGDEYELPDGHHVPFLYSTNGELIRFGPPILLGLGAQSAYPTL